MDTENVVKIGSQPVALAKNKEMADYLAALSKQIAEEKPHKFATKELFYEQLRLKTKKFESTKRRLKIAKKSRLINRKGAK